MKRILFGLSIAMSFMLGLASCSMFFGKATANASNSSGTNAPSLSAYNVAAVSDSRTDSNGNPLSQPYGSKVSMPLPRKQIYLGGPTYSGSTSNLIGFQANSASVLFQQTSANDTSWTAYPHVSVGARLGLTGKQTLISVVFQPTSPLGTSISTGQDTKGTVELVTWDGTTQTILHPFKSNGTDRIFDVYMLNWSGAGNSALSVAAGDIDGDGKDEIAFCVGNRFIILDDDLSTPLYDNWATDSGAADTDTSDFHPSCVAAGDVKNDGTTAFIVTYGSSKSNYVGSYTIFAGATPAVIATGSLAYGSTSLYYADAAFGDIDGNGTKDLLFAGRATNGNDCELICADWNSQTSNIQWFANYDDNSVSGTNWGSNPLPALACFDPDGKANNPRDLVLVWDRVLNYSPAPSTTTAGFGPYYNLSTLPDQTNVAAADINYDNQDELIALSWDCSRVDVYSLASAGATLSDTSIPVAAGQSPALCVADVEGESLTLEYLSKTVQYSNPQIIAVLASAPYYTDAASNPAFGNAMTSFGTTTTTGQSSSNSFTVSASFTLGVEAEAPLEGDAAKTSDKVTIGDSFTSAFESEEDMSYSHEYQTMAGQDAVVFSCVPFDVYTYAVLSAPNSAAVGKTMTIDFPRQPEIIQMERTAFNALPGNTLAVGSAVLSHTIGDPQSYPSYAAIQGDCAAGGWGMYDHSGMAAPSGSSQLSTDSVTSGQSNTTTVGSSLSIEASTENVVMGVLFGASVGFDADFDYSVTTSSSTEISGTVPSINSSDKSFQFGIAGYDCTNTATQPNPFIVVTYWVR